MLARGWATLAHLHRLCAEAAPGGVADRVDGHEVSVVPQAPDSVWQNVAIPVEPDARHEALDDWFRAQGVPRYGVWTAGARPSGMHRHSSPVAMAATLGPELTEDPAARAVSLARVGEINDIAYANLDGHLERVVANLTGQVHSYAIEDAAVAVTCEHGGDAGVFYVATLPSHRDRGLGSRVVRHAMARALRRGCVTSTLQAAPDGIRIYERVGYRRVATVTLWEHAA